MKKRIFKYISFIAVFILISFSLLSIGFSEEKVEVKLNKIDNIEAGTQIDPLFAFDNRIIRINDKLFYVQSEYIHEDYIGTGISSYSKDLEKEKGTLMDMTPRGGSEVRTDDKYIYFSSPWSMGKIDSDLNKVDIDINYSDYELFKYSYYDNDTVDTIYETEDGSLYMYSGINGYDSKDKVLKIDKEFTKSEIVTLTDEEFNSYFPDINKMINRVEALKAVDKENVYELTSYLDLKEGTSMYVGKNVTAEKAYMEVVDKNGEIIHSDLSSDYVSYSEPVTLKDYIIVKATHDEKETLGSIKSDLLILDQNGNLVGKLESDSYYTDLIVLDDKIYTERIYVEGVCTTRVARATYTTYDAWNSDSCKTYHHYEIYDLEVKKDVKDTVIEEFSPETSTFSILIFVVLSFVMIVIIKRFIKKSKDLY